jgi:hypothetical protein
VKLGRAETSWPCSLGAGLESSELAFRGKFGPPKIGGILFDSRPADNEIASEFPVVNFVIAESPVGSKLPSSDKMVRSGSKARAGTMADS